MSGPRRPALTETVSLPDRDRRIVQLVAKYQQVTSRQVHALLFPDVSYTPADRALKRLVDRGFLRRVERRSPGGARGGSGQYVYSLGRRGFYMHYVGRYIPIRAVRYHTLAIVDCVVELTKLERAGLITVHGISAEPHCWQTVGGEELKPDLYTEVSRSTGGDRLKLWLEVDMGSEGHTQLKGKLHRYWRAYNHADLEYFPLVLWVAVDDERAKELRWLIEQGHKDARQLFRVRTLANFGDAFAG